MIMLIPLIGNTNPTPWGRSGGSGGGRVKLKGDTMTGALYVVTAGDTVWINPAHLEMFRISYNNVLKFSFDSTGIFKANQIKSLADNDTLRLQYRTLTGTSGVKVGMKFNPTINQSSSAGYTGFLIDVTETATGSGLKKPFKINVNGSEIFSVSNAGYIATTNHIGIPAGGQIRFGGLASYITTGATSNIITLYAGTALVMKYESTGITPSVPINIGNFKIAEDAGEVTAMDMSVTVAPADSTPEGYGFSIDGTSIIKVKALSLGGAICEKEAVFGGYIARKTTTGITASETQTQAGGVALVSDVNIVTIVGTDNDACTMPPASPGREVIVYNADTGQDIYLFPFLGDNFVGSATDSSVTIGEGVYARYVAIDATVWLVVN